ncbi:MAG: alpha-L-fucosidase [Puia sp.]|nr:alpha-L-fucosidase [Puia sp.]
MKNYFKRRLLPCVLTVVLLTNEAKPQEIERWDNRVSSGHEPAGIQWFKDAKFGMFVHWGLYSQLAGTWKNKNYYGSGEWIMNRARIPAAEYAAVAQQFNPVGFDAEEWAKFARQSGFRYMVVTAKHHEGFAMFDSKVSDFNVVKASPYGKDPMKALSEAVRKEGLHFGFYYSQYLDWHEANGGGNDWDFDESRKDYQRYYQGKSVPQIKELLTHYGPLGILWFDMPGGLSKEQTQAMIDTLHALQPDALFSSRVGQGLGDYRDFGDSEVPPLPVAGAWEAIYTHNDSWGYISHDMNFKSSGEIIRLLAGTASKGGNLMLNIGPDGTGRLPAYSQKYLLETGSWLGRFGESIYGTTYGLVPAQPWGVTTSKPGKLYLHIFERPSNGRLLIPDFDAAVSAIYQLDTHQPLRWKKRGSAIEISIGTLSDKRNTVLVVAYKGTPRKFDLTTPLTVSAGYKENPLDAVFARLHGSAKIESLTFSHYFGDWKHATCVTGMSRPEDSVSFLARITDPGDYKVLLEYACPPENSRQEGTLLFDGKEYKFETLRTSKLEEGNPILFIRHPVAIVTVPKAGLYTLRLSAAQQGSALFSLKSVILEPVD